MLLSRALLFLIVCSSTSIAFLLPSLNLRPTISRAPCILPVVPTWFCCSLFPSTKAQVRLRIPIHCQHSSQPSDSIDPEHPAEQSAIIPVLSLSSTVGLREKIAIVLKDSDLDERFVRCTGNGGQKINKSSSKVDLVHKPTGIKVSCQDFRDLSSNRARARKLLTAKLDLHFNGKASKIGMKQDLVRKRKRNAARKAKKKYTNNNDQVDAACVQDDEAVQDDLVVQDYLRQVR